MNCLQIIVKLCLLLTVSASRLPGDPDKPFHHKGRCKINDVDGFCVASSECWVSNPIIYSENNQKCSSIVIEDLVCCPKKSSYVAPPVVLQNKRQPDQLPLPPQCGYALENRIVGGITTDITDSPWMALLRFTNDDIEYEHLCGGSLIANRWVVTAAHCVQNAQVSAGTPVSKVRLGEWNTTSDVDCQYLKSGRPKCAPQYVDLRVDRVLVHEEFNPSLKNYPNDIALLRLEHGVTYNEFISPICLPAANDIMEHSYKDVVMEISGWGNTETSRRGTNVKRKTWLSVMSQERCQQVVHSFWGRQLCAGGNSPSGSCHGDSGGPLIMLDNNQIGSKSFYLAGIISMGSADCSKQGTPLLCTKIENYVEWINQKIRDNS